MPTLGPQIVSQSYGNLLKFLPTGEDGVTTNQVQITDGKGKVTPLYLATGSVLVDSEFTASAEVVFSGLTSNAPGQYVSFDTSNGRLYYSATSSIQNVVSSSYALTASYAMNADDGDWTIGSSFMTASGRTNVYIPNKLENGLTNNAQGAYSHAEGANTIAIGDYSHAEGRLVSASGTWSHAEGSLTKTIANYAHAEGSSSLAEGIASHAEGYLTSASDSYAHAEGQNTKAIGVASHAEGVNTRAEGWWSHAEGGSTITIGDHSHAEGIDSTSTGDYSHAEGAITEAVGISSHAEGAGTRAEGFFSHAEGGNTIAIGNTSHAGGHFTTASLDFQTVVGQYNVGNYPNGNDTFVVGTGGDNNTREDAFKVRANTHEVIVKQQPGNIEPIPPGVSTFEYVPNNLNNGAGLYFGEPDSLGSTRVVSSNMGGLPGIAIQTYIGANYQNTISSFAGTTFIPTQV